MTDEQVISTNVYVDSNKTVNGLSQQLR